MLIQENRQISQKKTQAWPNLARLQTPYMRESQTQTRDDQLLNSILGRPVIRSIYDRQGDLILDVGDLITYRAVERAQEANMFELLLSSVYYN